MVYQIEKVKHEQNEKAEEMMKILRGPGPFGNDEIRWTQHYLCHLKKII